MLIIISTNYHVVTTWVHNSIKNSVESLFSCAHFADILRSQQLNFAQLSIHVSTVANYVYRNQSIAAAN